MARKKKEVIVEPVDITPEDSVVPVFLVPLTEAEKAERAAWAKEQEEREAAEAAKEEARESALAKLAKLGLTVEEIEAAFNIS